MDNNEEDVEDETNTIEKEDKFVICTLDFEKYYPSMNIDDCAEIVEQEWLKSDLDIEVDTVEMGLYLAITYQDKRAELVELGLDAVVQKRKHPKAKKILITMEEATEAEVEEWVRRWKRGEETRALVTDETTSRGWEAKELMVIGKYSTENLVMRTCGLCFLIKIK